MLANTIGTGGFGEPGIFEATQNIESAIESA
jgi:hypothetical protein